MIYIEHVPGLPLARWIDRIWYCRASALPYAQERVLPSGSMQILFNLAGETLTEVSEDPSNSARAVSHSLLAGPRCRYELIDSRDLQELLGILFLPGGAAPLLRTNASTVFGRFISLADVYPRTTIRDRLRELSTPQEKLKAAEQWLLSLIRKETSTPKTLIDGGLRLLCRQTVHQTASSLGVSERRLSQVFAAEVGLSPKQWSRIARFQKAVRQLHAGRYERLDQLALECGYYDQSHFCRDFTAVAGMDATAYLAGKGRWVNHVT
jgi:AraC-like DNA-binding protein